MHAIVARDTIVENTHVIKNLRRESRRRVAKVTILSRGQMVHHRVFTGRETTIVAPFTAAGDALVGKG